MQCRTHQPVVVRQFRIHTQQPIDGNRKHGFVLHRLAVLLKFHHRCLVDGYLNRVLGTDRFAALALGQEADGVEALVPQLGVERCKLRHRRIDLAHERSHAAICTDGHGGPFERAVGLDGIRHIGAPVTTKVRRSAGAVGPLQVGGVFVLCDEADERGPGQYRDAVFGRRRITCCQLVPEAIQDRTAWHIKAVSPVRFPRQQG